MLQEIAKTPASPARSHPTAAEAAASARAVVTLFDRWSLTDAEASDCLGGMAPRTWARWKSGEIGRIDRDLATRLSLLLGIHAALRSMFGTDMARVYGWMKAPNGAFDGQSALQVVRDGQILDLYRVRRFLDAERGGW